MSDDKFSNIPLCNADTYNEWQALFIAFLYSKDLEGYIDLNPTKFDNNKDNNKIKDSKHCYSYMFRTCLAHTKAALLATCCPKAGKEMPRPDLLWAHLSNSFSASVGPCQAALFAVLHSSWRGEESSSCSVWNDFDSYPDCFWRWNNLGLAACLCAYLCTACIMGPTETGSLGLKEHHFGWCDVNHPCRTGSSHYGSYCCSKCSKHQSGQQ